MSHQLLITGCTDHLMWYSRSVGSIVPLLRDLPDEGCFLSREHSGLTNIVRHKDAVLVPSGYTKAADNTLLQAHDLILNHGRWSVPLLSQLGTAVAGRIVIRRSAP